MHDRHGIESLLGVEPVRSDLLGPAPQVGRVHAKIPHIPLQSKLTHDCDLCLHITSRPESETKWHC